MSAVQNMVGGFLSSAVSNVFSNTTNIYLAVGITIALLVGTFFIYKWYATSVAVKKQVQFAGGAPVHPQGPSQMGGGPHLNMEEMPPQPPAGAGMMPPNVEAFENGEQQEEEEQQQ